MLTNSTQITVDGVYISFLALTEFFNIVIRSYVRINIRCMRNRIQPNILMRIQIQGRSERGSSKDPDPSYSKTRLPYFNYKEILYILPCNKKNTGWNDRHKCPGRKKTGADLLVFKDLVGKLKTDPWGSGKGFPILIKENKGVKSYGMRQVRN